MNRRRFLIATATLTTALAGGVSPSSILPDVLTLKNASAVSLEDAIKQSQNQGKAIFGSTEVGPISLRTLPRWARILKNMRLESPALESCAQDQTKCNQNALKAWRKIIEEAKPLSRGRKIDAVNRYFNRWPYKFDQEIYGTSEYWASPMEFMRRSGDCEDYAIAKFFALRQLGFRDDEMRIIILWDNIRAVGHAVLAVYEKDDILILDSLSSAILSHWKYRQYVPQYSMNETMRWAHVKT